MSIYSIRSQLGYAAQLKPLGSIGPLRLPDKRFPGSSDSLASPRGPWCACVRARAATEWEHGPPVFNGHLATACPPCGPSYVRELSLWWHAIRLWVGSTSDKWATKEEAKGSATTRNHELLPCKAAAALPQCGQDSNATRTTAFHAVTLRTLSTTS
ncbi:uncharacterized protein LY79DRAFT_284476 [Colletotrichum navitas]|uniref:Uncharacterized protein n=1 Tax=Colletotrichum navitas TaxID=681940 RepID=A0AAD8VAK8_9PEZI|nr:uncharacterized protein LY79DRAFT_284476 [Colletotrichum navitas]KAK1598263.1 hypothetical protein LY79DRAFT_284476 [Colletotrichum navitas]